MEIKKAFGVRNVLRREWNPENRIESFKLQLTILKFMGMWPPERGSRWQIITYKAYGWCIRIIFLYLFVLSQILFIYDEVDDLLGVAQAMFLLMTQVALVLKLAVFNLKINRIQKCLRKVPCKLYDPKSNAERRVIANCMTITLGLGVFFMTVAYGTIVVWTITPIMKGDRELPLPAWFPFDYKGSLAVYVMLCSYQIFSVIISASYNVSTDTFVTGLMAHVHGQTERLGILVSKLGYQSSGFGSLNAYCKNECDLCLDISQKRKDIVTLSKLHGKLYGDLIELVIFHRDLLRFQQEIIDIFSLSIFTQVIASVIIICMTAFLMAEETDLMGIFSAFTYLLTMVGQIFLYCLVGNKVSDSSDMLTERATFCNYTSFNQVTSKAFLFFLLSIEGVTPDFHSMKAPERLKKSKNSKRTHMHMKS
ncbi:odorant receptor Or1-like [Sabethes cyaneus]|uniref:odorant receptor Or1-like n=1 Tax=Sabethes cyaneus TaxID=53552 RepID=UPI00237EBC42|nr:odorant receptor Or1-like [Sabethes cyaneus]